MAKSISLPSFHKMLTMSQNSFVKISDNLKIALEAAKDFSTLRKINALMIEYNRASQERTNYGSTK